MLDGKLCESATMIVYNASIRSKVVSLYSSVRKPRDMRLSYVAHKSYAFIHNDGFVGMDCGDYANFEHCENRLEK